MIQPGDLAPDFEGTSTVGAGFRLSSLRGHPVVLYFYPRAGSLGCTYESMGFKKAYPSFQDRGIAIVGVSVDSLDDQRKFLESCALPFPLVADPDQAIARRFEVLGAFGLARRVSFLLDGQGRVLQVVESIRPGVHVAAAKKAFLEVREPRIPGAIAPARAPPPPK